MEAGYGCECQATHRCFDCHGTGSYDVYATEQMRRLRNYISRYIE
jgi:hypothetical protein